MDLIVSAAELLVIVVDLGLGAAPGGRGADIVNHSAKHVNSECPNKFHLAKNINAAGSKSGVIL